MRCFLVGVGLLRIRCLCKPCLTVISISRYGYTVQVYFATYRKKEVIENEFDNNDENYDNGYIDQYEDKCRDAN